MARVDVNVTGLFLDPGGSGGPAVGIVRFELPQPIVSPLDGFTLAPVVTEGVLDIDGRVDVTLSTVDGLNALYRVLIQLDGASDRRGQIIVPSSGIAVDLVDMTPFLPVLTDIPALPGGGPFLQPVNNLSDVANVTTARTNLGLGSAATHDAADFTLAGDGVVSVNGRTGAVEGVAEQAGLDAEAAARALGDSSLATAVNLRALDADLDAEVARATAAEAALSAAVAITASDVDLAAETSRAMTAEAFLQAGINGAPTDAELTAEAAARAAADAALTSAVNARALASDLTAETNARSAADAALSSAVAARALASDLTAEVSRATAAEGSLSAAVALTATSAALAAEAATRASADATLTTAVNARALASDLTAETSRATAAEGSKAGRAANLSDLTDASLARTNLGLGSAATSAGSAFDAAGAAAAAQAAAVQRANHTGTQPISTVVGLQPALDAKADSSALTAETTRAVAAEGAAAQRSANLSDLTNAATARTNLGLGTAATTPAAAYEPAGAAAAVQAFAVQRSNHTGAQAIATVTGLQAALDAALQRSNHLGTQAISTIVALQAALDGKALAVDLVTETNARVAADALKADLVGGKVPEAQLPSVVISEFLGEVASQVAMLALVGQRGDWAIRTDLSAAWILIADDASQLANWKRLPTPADLVSSVNGRTGVVTGLAEQSDLIAEVARAVAEEADIRLDFAAADSAESAARIAADALDLKKAANLSDLASAAAARANLGLGDAVVTAATTYTMGASDGTVLANATGGGFNVTLPAASAGRTVRVQKIDASANVVTVLPASGTIDGAASAALSLRWMARTFQSDGTNWFAVAKADPAGLYIGTPGVVAGASTATVVGSVKVTGDVSDRLRIQANGALLGGTGGAAPTVELKPVANGTGWEVNKGNLKIRADTNPAVAPELHFHSNRGAGTDNLAWFMGIDVANLANQSQDLAVGKGIGGLASDEFYGNGRRTLASTWAFGQAPADDRYKLSVVSSIAGGGTTVAAGSDGASLPQSTINVASTAGFAAVGLVLVASSNGPQSIWYTGVTGTSFTGCTGGTGTLSTGGAVGDVNMGGLKIQCATTTVGKALVVTDGAGLDRIWIKPDGTLTGNHSDAGSALCVEADPVNHRAIVMRDYDGTALGSNYMGWYYTAGGLRLRSISSALDFMKFSTAEDEVEVYRPLVAASTLTATSALIHTGVTVGFYGVGPAARPPAGTEILAALATTGLLTGGAATPLNLLGGQLSAGSVSAGTATGKAVLGNWASDSTYVEVRNSTATAGTAFALISSGATTIVNGGSSLLLRVGGSTTTVAVGAANTLGFFGASPAAKPTGVTVDAAGIHAALVTLGLIAA